MGEAGFKTGGETFDIFRLIAHVEADFVADVCAIREEPSGHSVRACRHFRPGHDAVAMDHGWIVWAQMRAVIVEQITEIPNRLGHFWLFLPIVFLGS